MVFCCNFAANFERFNNSKKLHYANKVFRIGSGDSVRRVNVR